MKITTSSPEPQFKPFNIVLTIESEAEAHRIRDLVTTPEAMAGMGIAAVTDIRTIIDANLE